MSLDNKKGFSTIFIILGVIVIVCLVGVAYYLGTQRGNTLIKQLGSDPNKNSSANNSFVNWKTYNSTNNVFSFKHPEKITLYESDDGLVYLQYKETLSPNEPDGYELSPGYLLNFKMQTLGSNNFRSLIEKEIESINENASITKPLTDITINNYAGLTFSKALQVESTHIYLLSQNKSYIKITYSINDKNNKGYQAEVDKILSTFKFETQKQDTNNQTITSSCNFSLQLPKNWMLASEINNVQSPYTSCSYIQAPDFQQLPIHGREGFFIEIRKIDKGSKINNITINSLAQYIEVENNATGSYMKVDTVEKSYGTLKGLQFQPKGMEYLIRFVSERGGNFYIISWPGPYREDYQSGYKGQYINNLDSILDSIQY